MIVDGLSLVDGRLPKAWYILICMTSLHVVTADGHFSSIISPYLTPTRKAKAGKVYLNTVPFRLSKD